MATYYAKQFVGVADGTKVPSDKADGRQVGADKGVIVATKDNTTTLVATDKIYIGKMRQGDLAVLFQILTDTSFGATTISIGTLTTPGKYVNALTFTTPLNVPSALGPLAAAVAAGPLTADEDIYVTLGVGGLAAAVVAHFITTFARIH